MKVQYEITIYFNIIDEFYGHTNGHTQIILIYSVSGTAYARDRTA